MPAFPVIEHSWHSKAEPIENVGIEVTESGKAYPYLLNQKQWYEVTLIIPVWHDMTGTLPDTITAFYATNRLDEAITFECKGYAYLGHFTAPPQIEQLRGFGMYEITCKFFAERTGKI